MFISSEKSESINIIKVFLKLQLISSSECFSLPCSLGVLVGSICCIQDEIYEKLEHINVKTFSPNDSVVWLMNFILWSSMQ